MTKQKNKIFSVIFFLLCYVLISIGTINPTAEISLALATLIAIAYTSINAKVIVRSLNKEHYILFSLLLFYVGIGVLTYYTHVPTEKTLSKIGTSLHFILIIFVILALTQYKISKTIFWLSIVFGAILNFIVAFYQSKYIGIRSHGGINAILFGDISILLGFMSAISYTHFKKNKLGLFIPLIGFICGIGASLLSQSRGGWIAIPVLILVVIFYLYYQKKINKHQVIYIFIASIVGIFLALYAGWDLIGHRIELAIHQFDSYSLPGNTNIHTSVGARLEIWKGAILLISDYPVLGAGMGGWQDVFATQASEGRMLDTSYYTNIHNQILQDGVDKGLIGILSYIAINVYLFYYFLSNITKKSHNHEMHLVGLLLVVGYFIFGLTNVVFTHGVFNTFFVAILALIFTLTEEQNLAIAKSRA